MASFFRVYIILAISLVLVGCKIRIMVPEGGRVVSESGAYVCESGQTCDIDIVDFFFDEKFIAEPKAGYFFRLWQKGSGAFCGERFENDCRLTTTVFQGKDAFLPFVEADDIYFLKPLFSKGSCSPATEIIEDAPHALPEEAVTVVLEGIKCSIADNRDAVWHGKRIQYWNDFLLGEDHFDLGEYIAWSTLYDDETGIISTQTYHSLMPDRLIVREYDELGRPSFETDRDNGKNVGPSIAWAYDDETGKRISVTRGSRNNKGQRVGDFVTNYSDTGEYQRYKKSVTRYVPKESGSGSDIVYEEYHSGPCSLAQSPLSPQLSQIEYINGRESGDSINLYLDCAGNYQTGERVGFANNGPWSEYNCRGELRREVFYVNGQSDPSKYFFDGSVANCTAVN